MEREAIIDLANAGKYTDARNALLSLAPADIAEIIEEIKDDTVKIRLFRILPKDIAAEIFADLHPDTEEEFISKFSNIEISNIITDSFMDDAVDIIEDMPENMVERILSAVPKDTRAAITKLLTTAKGRDTARALLTTEFIKLTPKNTVKQAFEKIRKEGKDAETVSTCYVVDGTGKLVGQVILQDLLFADPQKMIAELMTPANVRTYDTDDQEDVSNQFSKYHIRTLPVIDKSEKLIGIITADDIVEVIQEEATEDFQKIAAITPTDTPYLETSVWKHATSRVIWLMLLMVSAIFTGMLLSSYENAFLVIPALVAFIPMLMDTSGNCGSQTSILMIRGIALDQIHFKDAFKIFLKESRVSLLIGAILAVFNVFRIAIQYHGNEKLIEAGTNEWLLGTTIGLSLMCAVFFANMLGFFLPLVFKKIKLDPAIMASPVITTIVDLMAIFAYFSIAKAILPI
jgi:magnesium transporter